MEDENGTGESPHKLFISYCTFWYGVPSVLAGSVPFSEHFAKGGGQVISQLMV